MFVGTLFREESKTVKRNDVVYVADLRFVFVKTPHTDTGEFVVKGHHHVDVTKATSKSPESVIVFSAATVMSCFMSSSATRVGVFLP